MDGDSFGTPPESRGEVNPPGGGFAGYARPNKVGLGAGWRLLTYTAMAFVLWNIAILGLSTFLAPPRGQFSASYEFFGELSTFLAAFLAAWIMSLLEEQPVGVYGLPFRGRSGKLFGQGCFFGLCEISLLIGLIAAFGGYSFGGLAEHGAVIGKWALYWATFFVVVGLTEEFLFRGYSLHTLAEGIGFWPAAVVLSLGFGAIHLHNPGEGWAGIAGVAFVGLFWCFTLKRTGSLWFALGMHAATDFGETFLFSVPDSGTIFPGHLSNAVLHGPVWLTGGSAGPEASVFDFLILVVFFWIVHWLYPASQAAKTAVKAAA